MTSPSDMSAELPKLPEPIRAFAEFANAEGHDIAYTYDTDRSQWLFLNPMTADLWRYWQEAARQAMERCREVCERLSTRACDAGDCADSIDDMLRALIPQSEKRHG